MFSLILKDNVFIDFGEDVQYGKDQVYIHTPIVFPTVTFTLLPTNMLMNCANRLRMEAGYKRTDYGDEVDENAWFNFYIGLNGFNDTHIDTAIEAVVCNSDQADEGTSYYIDLTTEEQEALYDRLDEECVRYLEKTCEDLLEFAKEKMIHE